jgi:hypothetical protein
MLCRRACLTLGVSAGLFLALALPARAASDLVQKKSVSGPHGRSGAVWRYADHGSNHITVSANDSDGSGGKCTETWVDYSTRPHLHFNPGVLVNCSGGNRSVSGVLTNDYDGVRGIALVVCEVPDTSGRITRNSDNCHGNLSAVYLHSGKTYSSFKVNADRIPNGVNIWRV